MTISEVLADCLRNDGLTQESAAAKLGVKQSVVSRWVAGKDAPSDRYVPALVKLTGVSRRNVIEAIHEQRLQSPRGVTARVDALEKDLAEVKGQLEQLRRLLEGMR